MPGLLDQRLVVALHLSKGSVIRYFVRCEEDVVVTPCGLFSSNPTSYKILVLPHPCIKVIIKLYKHSELVNDCNHDRLVVSMVARVRSSDQSFFSISRHICLSWNGLRLHLLPHLSASSYPWRGIARWCRGTPPATLPQGHEIRQVHKTEIHDGHMTDYPTATAAHPRDENATCLNLRKRCPFLLQFASESYPKPHSFGIETCPDMHLMPWGPFYTLPQRAQLLRSRHHAASMSMPGFDMDIFESVFCFILLHSAPMNFCSLFISKILQVTSVQTFEKWSKAENLRSTKQAGPHSKQMPLGSLWRCPEVWESLTMTTDSQRENLGTLGRYPSSCS